METYISAYCCIRNSKIYSNGRIIFETTPGDDLNTFLVNAYRKFGFNYPKFFKMDLLCKLAFISSEILFMKNDFAKKYLGNETGIVLSNHSSSLNTDKNYFKTIQDKQNYFPGPSVFVYTLPNIMIGEICIKNKITGENVFFISEKFNAELLCRYINILFESGIINSCIGGWIELDENSFEGFLYFVEKKGGTIISTHNTEHLSTLYYKT